MQQQPLAFTLVKTVVLARDEGRSLGPAMSTAWSLLHAELSPAHRMLCDEVHWAPEYQQDLKLIIEGVQDYFKRDPALKEEFLAFLAEVEPYEEATDRAVLPLVLSASSLPTGDPRAAEELVTAEPLQESVELHVEQEPLVDVASQAPLSAAATTEVADPPVQLTSEPVSESTGSQNTSAQRRPTQLKHADREIWPFILAGAVLLGIFVTVYLLAHAGRPEPELNPLISQPEAQTKALSEVTIDRTDELEKYALAADSLRAAGNYQAAYVAQLALVDRIQQDGEQGAAYATALTDLASLASANNQALAALDAQREQLELLYSWGEVDGLQLGRSHLRMAHFYLQNDELLLASAHHRQAQHFFASVRGELTPELRQEATELKQRLAAAS